MAPSQTVHSAPGVPPTVASKAPVTKPNTPFADLFNVGNIPEGMIIPPPAGVRVGSGIDFEKWDTEPFPNSADDRADSDINPEDSVSQVSSQGRKDSIKKNPLAMFQGLEHSLHTGLARAGPKIGKGIFPSSRTQAIWYHFRGLSSAAHTYPKADQISRDYASKFSPAFKPPPLPTDIPISKSVRDADSNLMAGMTAFGAPAHLVCQLCDETEIAVTQPLHDALVDPRNIPDPQIRKSLKNALTYMQEHASYLMGLTMRSLGASYNQLAQKRRDAVVKSQPASVKNAFFNLKPGFHTFFNTPSAEPVVAATQATTLEVLLAALKANQSRSSPLKKSGNKDYRRRDNQNRQKYARDNQKSQNRGSKEHSYTPSKPSSRKSEDGQKYNPNRRQGRGGSRHGRGSSSSRR